MSENKKDNNIWISLRDYNCIKETKKDKFVVLNESTLIQTLEKTLDKWFPYIKGNKTLYDDIKQIESDGNKSYGFTKPIVEIKLSNSYEIYYHYNVSLKIEDFIKGAIKYLKDNHIHLGGWDYYFEIRLLKKLNDLKTQLKI